MRDSDGGSSAPSVQVDLPALEAAADLLAGLTAHLVDVSDEADTAAVRLLGEVIPPSDLHNAFAFCWGRWSSVLQNAQGAMRFDRDQAAHAAAAFRRTDRGLIL